MNTGTLPLMPTGDAIKGASALPSLPPPLPNMAPPAPMAQPPLAPQIPVASQPMPQASGIGAYAQPQQQLPLSSFLKVKLQDDGSTLIYAPGPKGDEVGGHVFAINPPPKSLAKMQSGQPPVLPSMGMPGMMQ